MYKATIAMSTVGGAVTASAYVSEGRIVAQCVRYLGTAALLFAVSRRLRRRSADWRIRRPGGTEWAWLIAAATAGLTIYNLAVVEAVNHAEAPLVASIVSGVPLVLALTAPLTAGRPITAGVVVGAAAVVFGSAVMLGTGRSDIAGVLLALTALAGECAFTLLGVPVLRRLGAMSIATHTAWIAAIELGVLAAVRNELLPPFGWDHRALAAIAYLIGASALAFVLWFWAIGDIGAERAGLAAGVIPIAALVTGVPLGIATLDMAALAGTAIVAAGVAIGLRSSWHVRAL